MERPNVKETETEEATVVPPVEDSDKARGAEPRKTRGPAPTARRILAGRALLARFCVMPVSSFSAWGCGAVYQTCEG